jgi:hypothetical protein
MSRVSRVRYMIDPDALRSQSSGEFLTDVLLSMAASLSTTGPNGPCVLEFYGANPLRDHQWQGNQWVVRVLHGADHTWGAVCEHEGDGLQVWRGPAQGQCQTHR